MSAKSKHTPGPWGIDDYNRVVAEDGNPIVVNGLAIPLVNTPESKANARLIAAAPELLEALMLADAALSGANMNMNVVQRKVQGAIAKAKGEQR